MVYNKEAIYKYRKSNKQKTAAYAKEYAIKNKEKIKEKRANITWLIRS